MTLVELVDSRKEIFRRPKTKKTIFGDKKIIEVTSFDDIVPAHEQRRSSQAILIKGVTIMPPNFNSAANFAKRGRLVRLNTYDGNQRRLRETEWSPLKARIEASIRYRREQGPFVGWSWRDPENYVHVVRPTTVIEGHRLHIHALKSRNIKDKIKVVKTYQAQDSNVRIVRVRVPARGKQQEHVILIEHFADLTDPDRFVEWTRLRTRHECEFKREDFTFKYKNRVSYCPHDVAAYLALARQIGEKHRRIIFQPFPLLAEPMSRLHIGLVYHTMIQESHLDPKTGKQRTRTRPLNFSEMDVIEMNEWLFSGNKATFYAHAPTRTFTTEGKTQHYKRMRDYNWSPDAPGMPFIH